MLSAFETDWQRIAYLKVTESHILSKMKNDSVDQIRVAAVHSFVQSGPLFAERQQQRYLLVRAWFVVD